MIIKRIKSSLFAFAIIGIVGLNAQNLNVMEKEGTRVPIPVNNIRTLTFQSGNLKVNLKVGTPLSFSLENVRNINFTPTTGLTSPEIKTAGKIHLFPNPAKDNINFTVSSANESKMDLRIIALDGRTVYTQKLDRSDNNMHNVNISTWPNGIYYLFINDGKTVLSNKFIKTN